MKVGHKEHVGLSLLLSLFSLSGAALVSWFLIWKGQSGFAKAIFLWAPILAIVATKLVLSSFLKAHVVRDGSGREVISKNAPRWLYVWMETIIPASVMAMVGYAFAHLTYYKTI